MAILAILGQYSTYTDPITGKYRVIWQEPDGSIILEKFPAYISDSEVEWQMARKRKNLLYSQYPKLPFESDANRQVIIAAVQYVRSHPALTLTQWNQYLNTLQWYDSSCVKAFIFRLAIGLAEHYGLVLDNYTESQVLLKVRNWICTTNLTIVQSVIFDRLDIIT